MPFTYTVMLIGTIALLGLPWLSGFYSKDLILELAYGKYQVTSQFAYILGTLTAFLTAFYSTRLINMVYLTIPNASKISYLNIHSENSIVIIPLSILAVCAIFLGYLASDFVGLGSDFFQSSLFYLPSQIHIIEAEFSLPLYIKLLPTVLSILGVSFAIYLYHSGTHILTNWTLFFALPVKNNSTSAATHSSTSPQLAAQLPPLHHQMSANAALMDVASAKQQQRGEGNITNSKVGVGFLTKETTGLQNNFAVKLYTFLNGKYLFDIIYNHYLISSSLKTGFAISKLLDKGIIELIGPFGLTEGSYSASYNLSKLDTGVITTYALYITLGLISILFILFFN